MCFKRFLFISILLAGILMANGCSTQPSLCDSSEYYLCNYYYDSPESALNNYHYDSGVQLLDTQGNICQEWNDATVICAVSNSNNRISPAAGPIPRDSILCIQFHDGKDVLSGVWDVENETWLLEPEKGIGAPSFLHGEFAGYNINQTFYFPDFQTRTDNQFNTFQINENLFLTNYSQNNETYIGDTEGNCYLDASTFYTKNKHLEILRPASHIEIKGWINNQYLMVAYVPEGMYSNNEAGGGTFLCDIDGNILLSEYDYDVAQFEAEQYWNNDSQKVLQLLNSNTGIAHYIDFEAMTNFPMHEIDPTPKYLFGHYFLLDDGWNSYIYNAKTQERGEAIESLDHLGFYALGLNSYVRWDDNVKLEQLGVLELPEDFEYQTRIPSIIIDGERLPDELFTTKVLESPYPIILCYEQENNFSYSYIINTEGKIAKKVADIVVFANEEHYLTVNESGGYVVNQY